ncbi:MAG: hypothetical protein J0I47_15125 [Sphingomonas sp.]|uniref:hypothetical protein n=1 Tax=Sphingomonas sp. TaxID=28214 RepID=UPI001AD0FFA7|nr:hypothetical protein [Sphingomonas sp.]MBN8809550.1 hypothetical protein [Sphingomonas sp.]
MTARSKTSKGVPLDEFGAAVAARKQALGVEMPRNAGNRRTPSKRALLAAIKELGGEW